MTRFRIRCMGLAGTVTAGPGGSPDGQLLRSYDPEAHDGRGWADWTLLESEAITFPTPDEAWRYIMREPTARPRRPDGRPNRPLTAFHLLVEPVEEEES
ncbi:MAG TPA: hypothetical protein VIX41_03555 [Acidimicrobiales bacterium]